MNESLPTGHRRLPRSARAGLALLALSVIGHGETLAQVTAGACAPGMSYCVCNDQTTCAALRAQCTGGARYTGSKFSGKCTLPAPVAKDAADAAGDGDGATPKRAAGDRK